MEIKQRGGARPGAGRKQKERLQGAVEGEPLFFSDLVSVDGQDIPRWKKYFINLDRLADGHFKADMEKETGQERIYWISPDRAANEYLLNRLLGKPLQKTELGGKDGGAIQLEWLSKSPTSPATGRKPSTTPPSAG